MRPSLGSKLAVQAVGVVSYLAGMLLMLFAGIGLFLDMREGGGESIPLGLAVYAVLGLLLVVLGRLLIWRYGGGRLGASAWGTLPNRPESDQSTLQQLGYNTEESSEVTENYNYQDGSLSVVCSQCGAPNETDYRFCRNCSAELPE